MHNFHVQQGRGEQWKRDNGMKKREGDERDVCGVCGGGSAGPAASRLCNATVKERGKPEAERDRTWAQPNPYTEAAEGHASETQSNQAGAELPEPKARTRAREAGPRPPQTERRERK
jgi:hypothetical protein